MCIPIQCLGYSGGALWGKFFTLWITNRGRLPFEDGTDALPLSSRLQEQVQGHGPFVQFRVLPMSNHPAFHESKPCCLGFSPCHWVLLSPGEEGKPSQSGTALCPLITAPASGASPQSDRHTQFHQVPSSRQQCFPHYS